MPLTYDIAPSGDQLRVVGSGPLTTDDLVAAIRLIAADSRWHLYASALVDLRTATYDPKEAAQIITVATALEEFRSALKGNIAIVVGPNTSFFAVIFAAHVRQETDIPITVFGDFAAAEEFCKARRGPAPTPRPQG